MDIDILHSKNYITRSYFMLGYSVENHVHNLKQSEEKRKILRKNLTPQEKILWSRLRRRGLKFKFKRQHSVGSFVLDFYCSTAKLAIEIDGAQHLDNLEYDNERTLFLNSLGITVLRFWNSEINTNIEGVMNRISTSLSPSSAEEGR